jgi:hypothetical protein
MTLSLTVRPEGPKVKRLLFLKRDSVDSVDSVDSRDSVDSGIARQANVLTVLRSTGAELAGLRGVMHCAIRAWRTSVAEHAPKNGPQGQISGSP